MSKQDQFMNLAAKHAEDEKYKDDERRELSEFAKKNKLTELQVNLAYARMAVNFIRKKIPTAANHDMYQEGSYDHEFKKTGKLDPKKFKDEDKCVNDTLRTSEKYKEVPYVKQCTNKIDCIEKIQNLSRGLKCGNCYEQASAAFYFLYQLGLRPIDLMSLYPAHLDHSFVVLGRTEGRIRGDDPWLKWGPGAVVCDPWAVGLLRPKTAKQSSAKPFGDSYGVYPAVQLRQKMKDMFPAFVTIDLDHYEE